MQGCKQEIDMTDKALKRVLNRIDYPSNGVAVHQEIEVIDNQYLDTSISIYGDFSISGSERDSFLKELGEVINKYRI